MDPPETDDRPPIDPRFHARRLEVAKDAGRRRFKWFVLAAILVVVVIGGALLVRAPFLRIDDVTVSGVVYTDPAAIDAAIDAALDEPILTVDTGAIVAALEAQPWVLRARAERDFPSGLRIEVSERTPLAVYGATDGRWRVVDEQGRVLAILDGRPVDVVLVEGEGPPLAPGESVPDALAGAVRTVRALPPTLKARTLSIVVDADGNLSLRLQPKGTVLLGSPDALRDKLIATLTVLNQVDPATVGTLDVRAPADPVLTGGGK